MMRDRQILNLLIFIASFLVVGLLTLFIANTSQAKDAALAVEFSYDKEFEPSITEFKLYCIKVPGSAIQEHVATLTDVSSRVWSVPVIDIPPGKSLDYYLSAVDQDGDEHISPAYAFKLIGRPAIRNIRKR